MLVLFKPSPDSIIKAFIAGRVYKAKPVEIRGGQTFFFEDSVDSEKLDYDSLYQQYKEAYGGVDFLEDEKLWEIMEDDIFWSSRFNAPDRLLLIFSVLSQIEKNGTRAYLAQQSPESKEMKDRIRRVNGEFRRAKKFIAFVEDKPNKVLIGRASFEHNIIDLVLRHYAKRYPGYSIAILDDRNAHICYKDEILIDARKKFPEKPGRKDSRRYWSLMSDLKHMTSKRDPDYQGIAPPKNYWKWVTDGAEVQGPVPKLTLDDFNL
jgi:hypothetical protein